MDAVNTTHGAWSSGSATDAHIVGHGVRIASFPQCSHVKILTLFNHQVSWWYNDLDGYSFCKIPNMRNARIRKQNHELFHSDIDQLGTQSVSRQDVVDPDRRNASGQHLVHAHHHEPIEVNLVKITPSRSTQALRGIDTRKLHLL
jgi:hypothetical protein